MITFDEARQEVTALTGYPTKEEGFEGPDRYIVVPIVPIREQVYNDSVVTVSKEGGGVGREVYNADEMRGWPFVTGSDAQ